ncbi:hypothetical protein [Streptomyces sp. NPDC005301]|uniref:hypothetical protein n=1 Tax=Streptomyces sp. NPDC005301 TaxID=3156874 RepID=UPI0033A7FA35
MFPHPDLEGHPSNAAYPVDSCTRFLIMKKIMSIAAVVLAATGVATPAVAGDDTDSSSGGNASSDWNFSVEDVCKQELAVIPTLASLSGAAPGRHCSDGNIINPSGL